MSEFDAKARAWDLDPERLARTQAVAEAIQKEVPLSSEWRALELGCGTGTLSFLLRPFLGEITLADPSEGMLEVLREKIAATEVTGLKPVKLQEGEPLSGPFDLIFHSMVLHHVPNTLGALKEARGQLRSGGYLAMVDLDAEDGSFHGPEVDVHHGFERASLQALLEEAGFKGLRFSTCFEMKRGGRSYPLFLVVAQASCTSPETRGSIS